MNSIKIADEISKLERLLNQVDTHMHRHLYKAEIAAARAQLEKLYALLKQELNRKDI